MRRARARRRWRSTACSAGTSRRAHAGRACDGATIATAGDKRARVCAAAGTRCAACRVCRTLHTLRLLRAPACARAGRSGCTTRHAHRTHACPFSPAHAQHTPPACPQALETFPTFLAVSLLGGVRHPLFVTAAGTPHKHHRSPFHTHTHPSISTHFHPPARRDVDHRPPALGVLLRGGRRVRALQQLLEQIHLV
jgi:hypothetical protein